MMRYRFLTFLLPLALSACATMGDFPPGNGYTPGKSGEAPLSLAQLADSYKSNTDNKRVALSYAYALRQAGDLKKAITVLTPFAQKKDASADILSEFAALQLDLTQYGAAENYARKAVARDSTAYGAYQILGISLEAQEKYEDAEKAFRQALDQWQGDPIPIMNNLAFNLTSQERLDEALQMMQKAKELAPNRTDVERNLRIIRTLNESASGRPAPKPTGKPSNR